MPLPFWSCHVPRSNSLKDFRDRSERKSVEGHRLREAAPLWVISPYIMLTLQEPICYTTPALHHVWHCNSHCYTQWALTSYHVNITLQSTLTLREAHYYTQWALTLCCNVMLAMCTMHKLQGTLLHTMTLQGTLLHTMSPCVILTWQEPAHCCKYQHDAALTRQLAQRYLATCHTLQHAATHCNTLQHTAINNELSRWLGAHFHTVQNTGQQGADCEGNNSREIARGESCLPESWENMFLPSDPPYFDSA